MERYIGIVTAVSGQRAKVRIERGLKKGEKPRILDCWNTCEAKKGTYVEVEEQTLGERQGKWIVRGIPLLTSCGSYFWPCCIPLSALTSA